MLILFVEFGAIIAVFYVLISNTFKFQKVVKNKIIIPTF